MPDPVGRQVHPAAVSAQFDDFFNHLFTVDLEFNLISRKICCRAFYPSDFSFRRHFSTFSNLKHKTLTWRGKTNRRYPGVYLLMITIIVMRGSRRFYLRLCYAIRFDSAVRLPSGYRNCFHRQVFPILYERSIRVSMTAARRSPRIETVENP